MACVDQVVKKFESVGAPIKISEYPMSRWGSRDFQIDVKKDVFKVFCGEDTVVNVVSTEDAIRHLLIHVKAPNLSQKYLCGHDERHWFVANVKNNVKNVSEAIHSLKPHEVFDVQKAVGVKKKNLNKRKNKGFIRQGEWFFVPQEDFIVSEKMIIHRNEPFSRPRGKSHVAEEAVRVGGRLVYVNGTAVMSEASYKSLQRTNPVVARGYRPRTAESRLYVRGKITHPDHSTVKLSGWHKVVGNSEVLVGSLNNLFINNLFID